MTCEPTNTSVLSSDTLPRCRVAWLGRVEYQHAWDMQREIAAARAVGLIPDTLLLLEHPPTYTIGPRGDHDHFLLSGEALAERGATVHRVDRGGDVTFHGPGQLVGYPILDIKERRGGVMRYLVEIMDTLILAVRDFGIEATRRRGATGIWVGDEKLAAIGVKVNAKGITSHGFALNVNTDLDWFGHIVPCGLHGLGVTSLAKLLGRDMAMEDVLNSVARAFGEVFGLEMTWTDVNVANAEDFSDVFLT